MHSRAFSELWLGCAVKMQLKLNKYLFVSMLTGLSYVQSHRPIVDKLLFCSLDPYLLGRGVAKYTNSVL